MIKINQLKLPVGHSQKDLEDKIRKTLRIPSKETFHYEVMRRSLDARKKPSLFYVYCIYVTIRQENSIVKKLHQPSVSFVTETGYRFSEMGHNQTAVDINVVQGDCRTTRIVRDVVFLPPGS